MKKQVNLRMSGQAHEQLRSLMRSWGTTQTETLTVIIDRAFQAEQRQAASVAVQRPAGGQAGEGAGDGAGA